MDPRWKEIADRNFLSQEQVVSCCCYFLDTNRKSPSHFNLLELKAQKYMKPHQKELAIEFGPINEQNVGQLKKLNSACFPISYNDSFYKEVVEQHNENLSKFAYWNGYVVGAVCTRIEPSPEMPGGHRLYIMTLGVLAPYRGRKIGSMLIKSILDFYHSSIISLQDSKNDKTNVESTNPSSPDSEMNGNTTHKKTKTEKSAGNIELLQKVNEITLHVQISNQDALDFYCKKFGFEIKGEIQNYYKRIVPPHCYILSKSLP